MWPLPCARFALPPDPEPAAVVVLLVTAWLFPVVIGPTDACPLAVETKPTESPPAVTMPVDALPLCELALLALALSVTTPLPDCEPFSIPTRPLPAPAGLLTALTIFPRLRPSACAICPQPSPLAR